MGRPRREHVGSPTAEDKSRNVLKDVFERLVPARTLDAYEVCIYLFLLSKSRLEDERVLWISVGTIGDSLNMTKTAIQPRLRSLQEKSCIEVLDTGWRGNRIKIFSPEEVIGPTAASTEVDLEALDFFRDEARRTAILEREQREFFCCLRALTPDTWTLDHVSPQIESGGNGYRNIVAACHGCNSSKGSTPAEDFLRGLYRRNWLSDSDLDARLVALDRLRRGELIPCISEQ